MRSVTGYPGLYNVAADRYKLVVYAGKDELGRQRQRTKTFRAANDRAAKKQARDDHAKMLADIERRTAHKDTIGGMLEVWAAHRRREDSPSTTLGQRSQLARIKRDLGHLRVETLTARQLDTWYAELSAKGMSKSTVRAHFRILHAAVVQWWDWGQCSAAPVDALKRSKPPTAQKRRPKPPTPQALNVMLAAAPPDLRLAATLAAATGMRRGEIIGLRWGDIDGDVLTVARSAVELGGGRQGVKVPKTGEPRQIRIGPDLLERLADQRMMLVERAQQARRTLVEDGPILADIGADPTGATPRRLGWLTLAWARHAEKCGAPDVRFHDLRHWHATYLLASGVDVKVTQGRLGHSTSKTTLDIYSHASDDADAAAAVLIEGLLGLKAAGSPAT